MRLFSHLIPIYLVLTAIYFHRVHAAQNTSFNPILKPAPYDTVFAGQYTLITWTPTTLIPVSLLLYFWGNGRTWILADNIPNTGQFHWFVNPDIAYPTLVNTPYAGDPNWFEIHVYNGSFRQTMGSKAEGYVGIADAEMEMNRGAEWFNITAPKYSVEVYNVITMGQTTSTFSSGVTKTIPVTWTTGPVPAAGIKDNGLVGGTGMITPGPQVTGGNPATVGSFGSGTEAREPSFASMKASAGISNWPQASWTGILLAGVLALVGIIFQ